jgi:hypothetical protein
MAYAGAYKCQDGNGGISFSDTPCATGSTFETASNQSRSNSNSQAELSTSNREAYTKDMTPMQSPDVATLACFSYINTTVRFPDPSTTKLISSTKKWVTVKDVGARQMVTIGVASKNEAGMYLGIQLVNCLLMGDHVTINTGAYELL